MYHKNVFLFLLFFILSLRSFSAVFVVTSKADSGPGTLREALTKAAANGIATKDFINFNLPDLSEGGRTIVLTSQLPDVSSNLEIDGTTQAGANFGVSHAKVAIFCQIPKYYAFDGLKIFDKHDVIILGLYIKMLTVITTTEVMFWTGIAIEGGKNIQIGSAGKGNVINGFTLQLRTNIFVNAIDSTENLTIKDNIFGFDADGKTISNYKGGEVALYDVIGQIEIGGLPEEGNLFGASLGVAQYQLSKYSPPAYIFIRNNRVGIDYYNQSSVSLSTAISIQASVNGSDGNTITDIEDNIISTETYTGISASGSNKKLTILRNYIGVDKTKTRPLNTNIGIQLYGIFLFDYTGDVQIGSDNTADANVIAYCRPFYLIETSKVLYRWHLSNV